VTQRFPAHVIRRLFACTHGPHKEGSSTGGSPLLNTKPMGVIEKRKLLSLVGIEAEIPKGLAHYLPTKPSLLLVLCVLQVMCISHVPYTDFLP